MNTVKIAAMNMSMSIKKLLINDLNFDVGHSLWLMLFCFLDIDL